MTSTGYMDRETSFSMDFGTLRAALYDDADCHGTIDSDTKFLYVGDTAVAANTLGITITSSTPKLVIEIGADASAAKQTSRMLTGLRVCFPIAATAMAITQTKVCTETFVVR